MAKRNWRASLDPGTIRLVKCAERQGWKVDITSNGHVRFRSPSGEVVIAGTAGRPKGLEQHHAKNVKRLTVRGLVLNG